MSEKIYLSDNKKKIQINDIYTFISINGNSCHKYTHDEIIAKFEKCGFEVSEYNNQSFICSSPHLKYFQDSHHLFKVVFQIYTNVNQNNFITKSFDMREIYRITGLNNIDTNDLIKYINFCNMSFNSLNDNILSISMHRNSIKYINNEITLSSELLRAGILDLVAKESNLPIFYNNIYSEQEKVHSTLNKAREIFYGCGGLEIYTDMFVSENKYSLSVLNPMRAKPCLRSNLFDSFVENYLQKFTLLKDVDVIFEIGQVIEKNSLQNIEHIILVMKGENMFNKIFNILYIFLKLIECDISNFLYKKDNVTNRLLEESYSITHFNNLIMQIGLLNFNFLRQNDIKDQIIYIELNLSYILKNCISKNKYLSLYSQNDINISMDSNDNIFELFNIINNKYILECNKDNNIKSVQVSLIDFYKNKYTFRLSKYVEKS